MEAWVVRPKLRRKTMAAARQTAVAQPAALTVPLPSHSHPLRRPTAVTARIHGSPWNAWWSVANSQPQAVVLAWPDSEKKAIARSWRSIERQPPPEAWRARCSRKEGRRLGVEERLCACSSQPEPRRSKSQTSKSRPCLVSKKIYKIFEILRHIKSLDACMDY